MRDRVAQRRGTTGRGRNGRNPLCYLGDTDIARASKRQHPVQGSGSKDSGSVSTCASQYSRSDEGRACSGGLQHTQNRCGTAKEVEPTVVRQLPALQTVQRFAEEAFCCCGVARRGEVKLDRIAKFVDGPPEVSPLAADLDVGLIDAPARRSRM